jgi:integrase
LLPRLEEADFTPKKTLGYYYALMMKQKDIKDTTLKRYSTSYNRYIKPFEDRVIDSFKVSELREWIASINISAKSIRGIANLMSQIFEEAIYDEVIDKNPCKKLRLPKVKKYQPEPFSKEEMRNLLENSEGWFHNLLGVLFMSGMRVGEALALTWEDITKDNVKVSKTISLGVVTTTKTENIRYIPMFNDLAAFFKKQEFNTKLKGGRVFDQVNDSANLRRHWYKLLNKCGMKDRVLYQTRHTFAIYALDSGMFKVSQIAYILGHSSVQMLFEKYAKFIKSEIEEVPKEFSTLSTLLSTRGA